ncbi:hypothetical protein QBZ16_004434 [Prototheca wickerhamii]|uniref:Rhodanese domain-containing protein n=1 Tax=Prototheca wickerhamii TaxID=3111 RepID=A0AAD9II84_PROWI|nr:hypothetical protein QBZ16_004434 [Prototheca wickerhamii]
MTRAHRNALASGSWLDSCLRQSDPLPGLPSTSHCILNFYHLVDVPRPHELLRQHRAFLEGRGVRGRIYISSQGINGQCGGETADVAAYLRWLTSAHASLFSGLRFKLYPAREHAFPRLRLKYRPSLISLAGGMAALPVTDPAARAQPLSAGEWRAMLERNRAERGPRAIVLDVRNGYEWDAGHFEGAARPAEAEFGETPVEGGVPAPLRGADPEAPVMMYCTGGIRCDVYSAHLRRQGFRNLFTLEGGVQEYFEREGGAGWRGSLYVFDGRMAVPGRPLAGAAAEPVRDEELVAAVPCQVCGGAASVPHVNCANIDCNALFIACAGCRGALRGCCCEACTAAPRLLRPLKQGGLYGGWQRYAAGPEAARAMAQGRGPRRAERRRERLAEQRERLRAKTAEHQRRRAEAEEVLRRREAQLEEARARDPAWVRLEQIRARLLEKRRQLAGEPEAQ